MKAILVGNHDAKNFNVKSTVLTQMFKVLYSRTMAVSGFSEATTVSFLHVLLQGVKSEWANADDRTKNIMSVLKTINTMIEDGALVLAE
jgi:hypothetical protein